MALPLRLAWDKAQDLWATTLNPVIDSPLNNSILLKNISLTTGNNTVNHKLGRKLTGWFITRRRATGNVYDTQDANQMPQLTLQLVSSAPIVVDLVVF